jgi:hypothetical protein
MMGTPWWPTPLTKVCLKCAVTQPASQYYGCYGNKDGLCGWCKTCTDDAHDADMFAASVGQLRR